MEAGIRRGIYPGAVVVIGTRDRVLYARGFGHFTWDGSSPAPRPDSTLWDLASLTKVVGTTAALMVLVDRGAIDLDAKLAYYLPRFTGEGKDAVTVRMLLNHTSGLPAYVRFFQTADSRDEAIAQLFREPLQRPPGRRAVYSDLNALLLGLLVEAVAGEPLDQFVTREVFAPIRMTQTRFRPPASDRPRTAPTGRWRGHPVAGEVNDQNAKRFGEVAGHAGLFSTGFDLARYAQMWLNRGAVPGGRLVREETLAAFLESTPASGSRLLGWDTKDPEFAPPSVFGALVSDQAYGHTGWTGTELWIDPARDAFLVFLTNRSYAPRTRGSIRALREVRATLSDAVVRAIPGACRETIAPAC